MKSFLIVAAGGALGAAARYAVYLAAVALFGAGFPVGTLAVNVVGSFAMGALVETMATVWSASAQMRLFLAVGILGAFTTFSSFSLDVAVLYERGRLVACATYIVASVVLSIGGIFAGMWLFRRLLTPVM